MAYNNASTRLFLGCCCSYIPVQCGRAGHSCNSIYGFWILRDLLVDLALFSGTSFLLFYSVYSLLTIAKVYSLSVFFFCFLVCFSISRNIQQGFNPLIVSQRSSKDGRHAQVDCTKGEQSPLCFAV